MTAGSATVAWLASGQDRGGEVHGVVPEVGDHRPAFVPHRHVADDRSGLRCSVEHVGAARGCVHLEDAGAVQVAPLDLVNVALGVGQSAVAPGPGAGSEEAR